MEQNLSAMQQPASRSLATPLPGVCTDNPSCPLGTTLDRIDELSLVTRLLGVPLVSTQDFLLLMEDQLN